MQTITATQYSVYFDLEGYETLAELLIPSRYSKTASLSISNILTPYLLQIAEDGGIESAIRCNKGLKNGVYLYHGILSNKTIGDWFELPYNDINLIVF